MPIPLGRHEAGRRTDLQSVRSGDGRIANPSYGAPAGLTYFVMDDGDALAAYRIHVPVHSSAIRDMAGAGRSARRARLHARDAARLGRLAGQEVGAQPSTRR